MNNLLFHFLNAEYAIMVIIQNQNKFEILHSKCKFVFIFYTNNQLIIKGLKAKRKIHR